MATGPRSPQLASRCGWASDICDANALQMSTRRERGAMIMLRRDGDIMEYFSKNMYNKQTNKWINKKWIDMYIKKIINQIK